MTFTRGAVLFSKPTNSGAIELRSGAITAAITGSTGFISNVPLGGIRTGALGVPLVKKAIPPLSVCWKDKIGGRRSLARWQGPRANDELSFGPA